MNLIDAQRVHDAHQTCKGKPTPAEYMRYMWAKKLLADAGRLQLTAGQRAFIRSATFTAQITGGVDGQDDRARTHALPAALPATTGEPA